MTPAEPIPFESSKGRDDLDALSHQTFHQNCDDGHTCQERNEVCNRALRHFARLMVPCIAHEFLMSRESRRHLKVMLSWPEPDPSVEPGERKVPKALPGQARKTMENTLLETLLKTFVKQCFN